MRCKWENKASTTQLVLEASGNRNGNPPKKIIGKRSKYTVVTILVKVVVVVVQGQKRGMTNDRYVNAIMFPAITQC